MASRAEVPTTGPVTQQSYDMISPASSGILNLVRLAWSRCLTIGWTGWLFRFSSVRGERAQFLTACAPLNFFSFLVREAGDGYLFVTKASVD